MDKDKVIDYVMNTPRNTNRQVLEGMLDESDSESVSGGSGLIVNVNREGSFNICDATWKTIHDAIANGTSVYFKPSDSFYDDEYYIAIGCTSYAQSSEYRVYYYIPTSQMHGSYKATSEDDYPKVDLD